MFSEGKIVIFPVKSELKTVLHSVVDWAKKDPKTQTLNEIFSHNIMRMPGFTGELIENSWILNSKQNREGYMVRRKAREWTGKIRADLIDLIEVIEGGKQPTR